MAVKNKDKEVVTKDTETREVSGYRLEKVPMPTAQVGATAKYPFAAMAVGESFEILGEKALQNVRNSVVKFRNNHPEFDYATRLVGTKEVDGVTVKVYRLWRMAKEAAA